jgi:predicted RNA-binding Zn-ribbon protein involved in translation (DUF1610 family)
MSRVARILERITQSEPEPRYRKWWEADEIHEAPFGATRQELVVDELGPTAAALRREILEAARERRRARQEACSHAHASVMHVKGVTELSCPTCGRREGRGQKYLGADARLRKWACRQTLATIAAMLRAGSRPDIHDQVEWGHDAQRWLHDVLVQEAPS